jgi:hypothetical protein
MLLSTRSAQQASTGEYVRELRRGLYLVLQPRLEIQPESRDATPAWHDGLRERGAAVSDRLA